MFFGKLLFPLGEHTVPENPCSLSFPRFSIYNTADYCYFFNAIISLS